MTGWGGYWQRVGSGDYRSTSGRFFIQRVAHSADPSPHGTRWAASDDDRLIGTFRQLRAAMVAVQTSDEWYADQVNQYVLDLHATAAKMRQVEADGDLETADRLREALAAAMPR